MYHIVYGLLYLLSLLPLRLLFLFSDFACLILRYIVGYRKKVVFYNLSIAFPEKTETERKRIANRFYRNFTDSFMETIKLLSADVGYINKHFKGLAFKSHRLNLFDELIVNFEYARPD